MEGGGSGGRVEGKEGGGKEWREGGGKEWRVVEVRSGGWWR